ncbi:hypothetical protein F5B18DRAFT_657130 [Nemania serpens]|nr:hypothetical protein F5B18DRAFT_657130 [Nemania serpens]
MAGQRRNNTAQQGPHGHHSSSRISMPLNPSAGHFTSGLPEAQRAPPSQPRSFQPRLWGPGQHSNGYTAGLSVQGRGQQVVTTPSQILTQPVQQGPQQGAQQVQYYPQPQLPSMMQGILSPPYHPPMYSQGGGQGYQHMFPMVQFPPPTPVYVGFPVTAHPIPLPNQQFPQQPHPGAIQAPVGQRPVQQGNNQNSAPVASALAPAPAPRPHRQSVPSTPAQSRNRTVSGSSAPKSESKPKEISESEARNNRIKTHRKEFEVARIFEDDDIYFPNDKAEKKD